MTKLLISIKCPDRTGLIAAVSGRLFDLGGDLGDTAFAAVAGHAEFTAECQLPAGVAAEALRVDLAHLRELAGADITVTGVDATTGGRATHRIVVSGGDRPGLIARLSEAFVQYDANILRLDANRIPGPGGGRYVTRFAVAIPLRSSQACLATIANTAGELGLTCHTEEA